MERKPQTLLLVWVLAVLTAAVTPAMTGVPTVVESALIPYLPGRLDAKADGWRHGNRADRRDG
jgi:hypothetical protein